MVQKVFLTFEGYKPIQSFYYVISHSNSLGFKKYLQLLETRGLVTVMIMKCAH